MTLPVFRRSPDCPKCGHDGIEFHYKDVAPPASEDADAERRAGSCGYTAERHFSEHIHLICTRCGYGKGGTWLMAVAEDPERKVGFRIRPPRKCNPDCKCHGRFVPSTSTDVASE